MTLPKGFEPVNEKSRTYFTRDRKGNSKVLLHIPGPIVGLRVKRYKYGGASHAIATTTGHQYYVEADSWSYFTFEGGWTLSGDEFPEPKEDKEE